MIYYIKKFIIFLIMLLLCLFTTACAQDSMNTEEEIMETSSADIENPFEMDNGDTIILGSLFHTVAQPDIDEEGFLKPFQYNGGEFELAYEVKAEGEAKNVGFYIFLNGKPQPYRINSSEQSYEYFHVFDLKKDNEPINFSFYFIPVSGEKGDIQNITVVSIYNPQFIPDMKETMSYGMYHTILQANYPLQMNESVDSVEYEMKEDNALLSDVIMSSEAVTAQFIETELNQGMQNINFETLNSYVFPLVYFNEVREQDHLLVDNNEQPLPLTFKICGIPGVEYNNIFFINHRPITDGKNIYFNSKLEKGNIYTIEADLDISQLEDFNTFYVISVPVNEADFPDEVVTMQKTPSILLYKEK